MCSDGRDFEMKCLQEKIFDFKNLFFRISIISNIGKFIGIGRINFFTFARNSMTDDYWIFLFDQKNVRSEIQCGGAD